MADIITAWNPPLRKSTLIDLTSMTFGHWTVIKRDGTSYQPLWECRCDCGTVRQVSGANLRSGTTTNCGCKRAYKVDHGHSQHGRKTRTYRAWTDMRSRCRPGYKQHKDYFDRGITVCSRWESYNAFLVDMGECPGGLTLDRKNNDGIYEPGNCRWADRKTQRVNSRRVHYVQVGNELLLIKDAAAKIGVTDSTVYQEAKRHRLTPVEAFARVFSRHPLYPKVTP